MKLAILYTAPLPCSISHSEILKSPTIGVLGSIFPIASKAETTLMVMVSIYKSIWNVHPRIERDTIGQEV